MQIQVAFVFGNGVEELELIAPADLLRRAGAKVWFVSTEPEKTIATRGDFRLMADARLEEICVDSIDLLVLPGGPGVMTLRKNQALLAFVRDYAMTGKPLAAICAAPLLLHDAGLLHGRCFTCHDSCWDELTHTVRTSKVVIDRELITSQGAGTAVDFGLALVEKLFGAEQRAVVSRAIMV